MKEFKISQEYWDELLRITSRLRETTEELAALDKAAENRAAVPTLRNPMTCVSNGRPFASPDMGEDYLPEQASFFGPSLES